MTRTHYALAILLLLPFYLFSQNPPELMGVTSRGGNFNTGSIYSITSTGSDFKINYHFDPVGPFIGFGALHASPDGKLYGMTIDGGDSRAGTVFWLNPDGSEFTVIHQFNEADGRLAYGSLIEDDSGMLYGISAFGGDNDEGVLYSLSKDGSQFSVLHHFEENSGKLPFGTLLEASNGILFGLTNDGGSFEGGTVFSINKDGSGFESLYSFEPSTEGARPYGALIEDSDGWLYGCLSNGGTGLAGGIYRIQKDGSQFSLLKTFTFDVADGGNPLGSLFEASNGKLYGTTAVGGADFIGTVFSMEKDGSGFTLIHEFSSLDGSLPFLGNRLIEGSNGNLYGVNYGGGTNGLGTIYSLDKDGNNFTVFHNFNGFDGGKPWTGLSISLQGKLVGITPEGGNTELGLIFEMEEDGTGYQSIYEFSNENSSGYSPSSIPLEVNGDFIFGTTLTGGNYGFGTVYRTDRDGSNFTVTHHFVIPEGKFPETDLMLGSDGFIYGTAREGGIFENGTIYRMNSQGFDFAILHHFDLLGTDGARPTGGLIEGENGLLYGTTQSGGTNGVGLIYSIDKTSGNLTVLFSFSSNNLTDPTGNVPAHRLYESQGGALFGVTRFGGDENITPNPTGTLFKINNDGTGYVVLKHFDAASNGSPSSSLISNNDGYLYGTTINGGVNFIGTIYRIAEDGSNFQTLFEFDVVNGISPQGSLLASPVDDWIYGVARTGGNEDRGVVFRILPDGSSFERIHDFAGNPDSGSVPVSGLIWLEDPNSNRELSVLRNLKIGPNPSAGPFQFIWDSDFPINEMTVVTILDESGKTIFSDKNSNILEVNSRLKGLNRYWPNGLYFIDVEMKSGKYQVKLILQR